MKTVRLIARLLLGLVFLTFGLNGFLHFIPMPPTEGLASEYLHALVASHYMDVVMGLQVVGGALLLIGWFIPFALTLLGPVLVNIVVFHTTMDPKGLPLPIVLVLLWTIVFSGVHRAFSGVFEARARI